MFLTEAANRGSISTGYDIDNSLKLEADNTEFMDRIITTTGNRRTWTHSSWVKRTEISYTGDGYGHTFFFGGAYGSEGCILRFNTGTTAATLDTIQIDIGAGGTLSRSHTSQVFRDAAAWYHIVLAVDTTQSTATDRFKLYVNGELVTSYYSRNNPAQNFDTGNNYASSSTYLNNVGAYKSGGTTYGKFCGYIAESYNIDGSALAPTEFGEFDEDSGIWKPKEYTGSFPNNSWYLDFEDSSDLGAQAKGDDRNFTLNNIAAADQATDTPTNNFCTLNVLNALNNGGGNNEYTEGATKGKALETAEMASGTMAVNKGKWYYECKALTNSDIMAGWGVPNLWGHHSVNPGYDTYSFAVHSIGRAYYYGNSYIDFSPSVEFNTNDIVSVALDADNGFAYWAKNGTWMNGGNPTSGSTGTGGFNYIGGSTGANMDIVEGDYLVPAVRTNYATNGSILLNFGGYTTISISSAATDADGYGTFEYAPPSGYYALCTKNLAEYG